MLEIIFAILGKVIEGAGINAVISNLSYQFKKPTYDKIKREKILPCVNEIVSGCNHRLSTTASADEISKLIIFESGSESGNKTEEIGKKLIISLSESARKENTLGYETSEKIAIFVFQTATNGKFMHNKQVGAIAQHVILPDALSKIEENYGRKFMSEKIVNAVAVEHFALTTDRQDFFKNNIAPMLKPGNDTVILRRLKSEANRRDYKIDPKSPVYETFQRNENMSSYITVEDMVRLTMKDTGPDKNDYCYVRGLKYIYENPNCRLTDISRGLGVSWGTAQWSAWKHWKNTKLVDKIGKRYHVSQKYTDMRTKFEHKQTTA